MSTTQQKRLYDPSAAFERALASGRLSGDPRAKNYVGFYMFMGLTVDGKHDAFKHTMTREYLPVQP